MDDRGHIGKTSSLAVGGNEHKNVTSYFDRISPKNIWQIQLKI